MLVYRRKPRRPDRTLRQRLDRWLENTGKVAFLLALPVPATALMVGIWYFVFFKNHIHFHKEIKEALTGSWIPIFGVLYSVMATAIILQVFSEYKLIRMSVKEGRFEDFAKLVDEDLSPTFHAVMTVLALAILMAFMGIEYPDFSNGAPMIGGAAYLFALMYWVVKEIDDPCYGIWVIKSIPESWLAVDIKKWRSKNVKVTQITITEEPTPPEKEKAA